jgi:hypothetical protein
VTRRVRASYWALLGKESGTRDDYRVRYQSRDALARRDDQIPARHDHCALAGIPSTPQLGGAPGPGQLPWATFTPHVADGEHWMAATVIDPTRDRDAVGRPVVAIRYMELPFAEFAGHAIGYAALTQSMPTATVMEALDQAPPPLFLAVRDSGGAAARGLSDATAFDRAARLAALLLSASGEVLITVGDRETLPLRDRLAEFDAVLSLLPFGFRAGISLASWHDGTQATAFRLAFGKFATRGQPVAVHDGPVPPPADDLAESYLRLLRELRDRFGAGRVVEHLASHHAPLGVGEDPQQEAAEILRSLDNPALIVDAVRHGRPSVERVANARRYAAGRLDQGSLDELEMYLLSRGGDAEAAIQEGWSAGSAAVAARLAVDELAAEHSQDALRLSGYAARYGDLDLFLSTVVTGRAGQGQAVPPSRLASLLHESVQQESVRPTHGDLPRLRETVLEAPEVARWLLRLALRQAAERPGGQHWREWLGWLDPSTAGGPDWLHSYAVLAAPPGTPVPLPPGTLPRRTDDDDTRPAADGAEDLALIAWCAFREGGAGRLDPQWWPTLQELARPGGRDADDPAVDRARADLRDLLRCQGGPAPGLPAAVRLDTLRLYLRLAPRHYPVAAAAPPCREYLSELWTSWLAPPANRDVALLTARLLTMPPPGLDPVSEAAVTLLYEAVTDDRVPFSAAVADAVAEVLAAEPRLTEDPRLPPGWWTRVEHLRPGLRTPQARLRAAVHRADADPVEVAVICGRAAEAGTKPEELDELLAEWLRGRTAAERAHMRRLAEAVFALIRARAQDAGSLPAAELGSVFEWPQDSSSPGEPLPEPSVPQGDPRPKLFRRRTR